MADARRAGHVDFGQVVTDDVDAGEQDARIAEFRADAFADLEIAVGERLSAADRPHHEVAAVVVRRRNPGERVRYGLAVDQKDALVPTFGDFGNEDLRDRRRVA